MAKQLLTEADVRRLAPGGELVLGPDRIATPAALDAAFERGMRVVYTDVAQGDGAPSRPPAGLWERMKSQDGTYVVVVERGRAVVTRVDKSGAQPFGAE